MPERDADVLICPCTIPVLLIQEATGGRAGQQPPSRHERSPAGRRLTPPHGSAPRTIPRWLLLLVALLGIAALGGAGAVGYAATQELSRQQSDLEAAQAELQSAKTDLASVQASVAEAQATHRQAADRLAALTRTFEAQTACVDARDADFRELDRISRLLNDNWNRTAEGSDFDKAAEARNDAINDALKGYNRAAYRRSLGQISSANSWLAKARAAEKLAAQKKTFMDGVLADVSDAATDIKSDLDELEARLDQTRVTCARTG